MWVTKFALDAGAKVRVTVRDASSESKTVSLKQLNGADSRMEIVSLDLVKAAPADFERAVKGCTMVLHTASPFPSTAPAHENDLIKPAVEGTMGVLRAVQAVGGVKRVVVTSSVAAVGSSTSEDAHVRGEADWTDLATAGAYPKSKTLAEKAAWDFHKSLDSPTWSLSTVNPCFVMGPSLNKDVGTSTDLIRQILSGFPAAPALNFGVVDVRDVAHAHVLCLIKPVEAIANRRFIVMERNVWMVEMGKSLSKNFHSMGYNPPTIQAPTFIMWFASFFNKQIAGIFSSLGKVTLYDSTPSKEVLGLKYHDFELTLSHAGSSAVEHGLVKRTAKFKPTWTVKEAVEVCEEI